MKKLKWKVNKQTKCQNCIKKDYCDSLFLHLVVLRLPLTFRGLALLPTAGTFICQAKIKIKAERNIES